MIPPGSGKLERPVALPLLGEHFAAQYLIVDVLRLEAQTVFQR